MRTHFTMFIATLIPSNVSYGILKFPKVLVKFILDPAKAQRIFIVFEKDSVFLNLMKYNKCLYDPMSEFQHNFNAQNQAYSFKLKIYAESTSLCLFAVFL